MYLIRRTYKIKPNTHRQAAELLFKIAKAYEDAGQRTPSRIYWSGGTVPGTPNQVYMDWTAEKLESPYREGNKAPPDVSVFSKQLAEIREESWIEFFELTPLHDKP